MKKIEISDRKGKGKYAIVDNEDYEFLNQWKWKLHMHGYAVRSVYLNKTVRMHREVMNAQNGDEIDHINNNPLDNRKVNLRFCTHGQNLMNMQKDKIKGVGWHKDKKKWRAYIRVNEKQMHLGYFNEKKEAADAYDKAAKKYYGEYANINDL